MKRFLSLLVLGLFLAGCSGLIPAPQTDPTRYYVLTGPPLAPAAAGGHLRVGLHTVEIATYLKSPDMIVRQGMNEIFLQDYARWGEPLEAGIGRILRDRLRTATAVERVYPQPFPLDAERDVDVTVTVVRCEGGNGPRVARFAATIELTKPSDGSLLARRTFVAPDAAWDGKNFDALAGLLSADVDALGREIVAALPGGS
jgi:uncharacterized lipoprotein YmbA